ncbi:MAG: class I SAM-dependent methyltransferase [Patescibacteria group bacterium]|nr:class I SAM-dependent methyltransferase [Patescibacteria group bacterium]
MDSRAQNEIKIYFDKLYQSGVTPWKEHPPEEMLERFLKYLKEKTSDTKVLDIGCGDGWISIKVAQFSFEVWGIDSSETAIEHARVLAKDNSLDYKAHFQVGDALNLPYKNNNFDALIDRGLFHHILPENRNVYLQNILRVLRKKSYIYLAVFSEKNFEGIGQRFTKKDIGDIFGQYFKIVYFDEDPYPSNAPAHLIHLVFERK